MKVYQKGGERGKVSAREERGIALAEEHFDQIIKVRPWTWIVPGSDGRCKYEVNIKYGVCGCPDHPPEGERCKHYHAAIYKQAHTGQCAGCRNRYRFRHLVEVEEDQGSLTFFPGDLLCFSCSRDAGVL